MNIDYDVIYYQNHKNLLNTEKEQQNLDFNKIASDISNYLFVPEYSSELQFLYMLGEAYNNKKMENIQQFSGIIEDYENIIKIAAKFIRELGIKDNYTSYYVIFSYLLWNGFFSRNMKYIYKDYKLLDLKGFHGIDIINGEGCCRSISNLLNNISHQLGFDTHFLVNSSRMYYRNHIIDIERRDKLGVISPTIISQSKNMNSVGNHASILLNQNGNFYIYDATNLSIYRVDESLLANMYNGIGECHIKPWGFIMYENMKQYDILGLLFSINYQNSTSFISSKEIREISDESLSTCKKNKSLMLDFHNQIQYSIKNINASTNYKTL